MNALWLIAAVAAPICFGWFVVGAIWPNDSHRRDAGVLVFRSGLAVACGFAVCGIHYFVWRAVSAAPPGSAFKVVDCLALPALAFFASKRFGKSGGVTLAPAPALAFRWRSWQGVLLLATLAIVTLALLTMAGRAWLEAYGYWDAWAIWNLKARFMFGGGPEWSAFFSRHAWYAHPDYPLLLPASIARLWTYLGDETVLAPQLFSVGSAAVTLVIVFGAVATLRGIPAGCLAALIVVGAERVLFYGGSQMADIPLAALTAAGVGLIALAGRAAHGNGRLFLLAGLFIGFATFLKNEGLMLALCMIAALTIARSPRRTVMIVLTGMAAGLLTLAAQRIAFPADTYMLADQESSPWAKATDPTRHATILRFIARTDFGVAPDGIEPNKPMLWLLLLLPLIGGFRISGRDRFAIAACGVFLVLACAGYYFALLVMPYDLYGNLHFGFDRVQLHIYPSLVVTIMLLTRRLPGASPSIVP